MAGVQVVRGDVTISRAAGSIQGWGAPPKGRNGGGGGEGGGGGHS